MGRMFCPAPELSVLELSVAAVSSDRHAAWTGSSGALQGVIRRLGDPFHT